MSLELQLALAPARTFRQLVADGSGRGWRALAAPLAFTFVFTGCVVAIFSRGRVDLALVATTSLTSSFTLVIQLIAALALVASAPRRPVPTREALALFFRAHLPWSAFLLALAAVRFVTDGDLDLGTLGLVLLVPVVWTTVLTGAFAREVLGASVRGARTRAAGHLLIVWTFGLVYIAWAAGGEGRIVTALAP